MTDSLKGAYDRCLTCAYLGDGCDGPNTLSMTLERWCEWCKDLKTKRKLTNSQISEDSGVSLKTVERIMVGTVSKDIMRSTASDINRVLVGSEGQWPCSLAFDSNITSTQKEIAEKDKQIESLRKTLENIHASYQSELDTIRAEKQRTIDYLIKQNEQKDRIIEKLIK